MQKWRRPQPQRYPTHVTFLATIPTGWTTPNEATMRPLTLNAVLVATDLSDDDLPAVRTACELARLADATLHVVHAVADANTDRTAALEAHIRAAQPSCDVLPGMTLHAGHANHVIVDAARMIDAAVIILGPHRTGHAHPPGGTAWQVVASAERPCLVLPGAMKLPLGRVLVPIDASGAARGALAVGMAWASALRRRAARDSPDRTELVVLHVESPDGEPASAEQVMEDAVTAAADGMADYAGVRVRRVAERGADAASIIHELAAAEDFDLIVLGTRAGTDHSGELGSVSSAVVRSATRPVLLVPPRVWRERGAD
jgi:nucleotide-binding universal stress UspA family protein